MSSTPHSLEQISLIPNVLGVAHCSDTDETVRQTGSEAEALGNVLAYFRQVSELIGASLGLESLDEAQMNGKSVGVLCLPVHDGTLGVVLNSRAKLPEVSSQVRKIVAP